MKVISAGLCAHPSLVLLLYPTSLPVAGTLDGIPSFDSALCLFLCAQRETMLLPKTVTWLIIYYLSPKIKAVRFSFVTTFVDALNCLDISQTLEN